MRSRPAFFLFISLFCVFRLFPASIAACSSRSTFFFLFCSDCRVFLTEHFFLLILRRLPRTPRGALLFAYFASIAACPLRSTPFFLILRRSPRVPRSTPFLFHSPPLPFSSSFSAFLAFRIFKRLLVPLTIITSASKSATT